MKRFIFILLTSFFVCPSYTEEHLTPDQLQELLMSIADDPMLKPIQEDYEKIGRSVNLYYGVTELEQRIYSNIYLFAKSHISGNTNSEYSSYSAQMHQAENDYAENLDSLHPNSVLRWMCPYYLGLYHWMHSYDIELSISYIRKADEFIQSLTNGKFCIYHTFNIYLLSQIFCEKMKFQDAIDLVTNEMNKLSRLNFSENLMYAQLEYTLSKIYYEQEDYENAIIHLNNALSLFNKKGIGESLIAFYCYNDLASCYALIGDEISLIKALECLINSFELLDKTGIDDSDIYLDLYRSWLSIAFQLEDMETILDIIPTFLDLTSNILETKIPLMSESERYNFWTAVIDPIYSELLPIVSWINETGPMSYYMYVALLQSRGLQLNCNNYFRNLITSSGEESLIGGFNKLNSLKSEYNRAKSDFPINKDLLSELKLNISQLEHNLLRNLKEHNNDILSWMNVSVEDIKAVLKDDELAVEFFTIPLDKGPYYCALVINNDTSQPPTYIDLLSEENFNSLKNSQMELSDSVWSKIIDIYPNVTKLYFAPCGEMNNFPIELCLNTTTIPNKFSAVRLSSTRELALNRKIGSDEVVLLGDFNYNQSLRSIISETQKLSNLKISESDVPFYENMDEEISGVFEPLPGTNIELRDLSHILGNQNVKFIYGEKGIESAFKALSGKPYKILHIATHGYFNNHGNNPKTAMDNCGLVFSGVNTLDNIDILPLFLEDGKLTASEIANLDLWGTGLVCLSACNSGKSSISSEGAYGLQRGLKLAGVNSIMMSLWDIQDNGPTNLMMSSFYKYYIESNDKLLSYQNAVRDVKKSYPNFKDWASFIIIDAL